MIACTTRRAGFVPNRSTSESSSPAPPPPLEPPPASSWSPRLPGATVVPVAPVPVFWGTVASVVAVPGSPAAAWDSGTPV